MATLGNIDQQYVREGKWRCAKSPTGAHHWIATDIVGDGVGEFQCKWCLEVRTFPITLDDALGKHHLEKLRSMVYIDRR